MKLYRPGEPFKPQKLNGQAPAIRMGTKHLGKPGIFKDPNTGYVAQSRKRFVIQNPDLPKNRMKVSLVRTKEGKFAVTIEVWATHGTGNRSIIATVDPGQCENAADLQKKVQIAAGAAAEHLCEAYGDDLDPDYCAKMSLELLREVMQKQKDKT